MSVNMTKREAKHSACDTWQDSGAPCTHPDYCDRVVLITLADGFRAFVGNENDGHAVPTQPTAHARHAA